MLPKCNKFRHKKESVDTDIRYVEYCRIHVFKRKGVDEMKDVVLDEIMKELSWKEKIVVKILAKTFYKVYKLGITFGFNNK